MSDDKREHDEEAAELLQEKLERLESLRSMLGDLPTRLHQTLTAQTPPAPKARLPEPLHRPFHAAAPVGADDAAGDLAPAADSGQGHWATIEGRHVFIKGESGESSSTASRPRRLPAALPPAWKGSPTAAALPEGAEDDAMPSEPTPRRLSGAAAPRTGWSLPSAAMPVGEDEDLAPQAEGPRTLPALPARSRPRRFPQGYALPPTFGGLPDAVAPDGSGDEADLSTGAEPRPSEPPPSRKGRGVPQAFVPARMRSLRPALSPAWEDAPDALGFDVEEDDLIAAGAQGRRRLPDSLGARGWSADPDALAHDARGAGAAAQQDDSQGELLKDIRDTLKALLETVKQGQDLAEEAAVQPHSARAAAPHATAGASHDTGAGGQTVELMELFAAFGE